MKKLYTLSIDFVADEEKAKDIAIAIAIAACEAGENAGGEEVQSQPYDELRDIPPTPLL